MKTNIYIHFAYACEKCGAVYEDDELAKKCESLPVSEYKFKIGDRVVVVEKTKGAVFKKPVKAQVVGVAGPYPPHPLAGSAMDFRPAKIDSAIIDSAIDDIRVFPIDFYHKAQKYLDNNFCQNSHVYFYAVIGVRKKGGWSWFFEEELEKQEGKI